MEKNSGRTVKNGKKDVEKDKSNGRNIQNIWKTEVEED